MRRPKLAVLPYRHSKTHRYYLDLRPFGQGRKFFKTRTEADAERLRQIATLERHGREAVGLPAHVLSEFIKARKRLAAQGKSITDATDFFIRYLEQNRRCNTTIAELAAEVLEAKRKDGRAPMYLADLRKRLARFCEKFGTCPIASITVEEMYNWLRALPLSPKSRANYRANIGVLFSYAADRRMIDSNPVLHTAKPKLIDSPPEIFGVEELRALLEAAQLMESSILPMLAIGAFAGLRDAEIKRLDWGEVNLMRGFIEVKASKAKSARRRIVQIQPNLGAWLRPHGAMQGYVVPVGARGKLERVRKVAGLTR